MRIKRLLSTAIGFAVLCTNNVIAEELPINENIMSASSIAASEFAPTVEISDITLDGYSVDYDEAANVYHFTLEDESLMDVPTSVAIEDEPEIEILSVEMTDVPEDEENAQNGDIQTYASGVDLSIMNLAIPDPRIAYDPTTVNFRIRMVGTGTFRGVYLGFRVDDKQTVGTMLEYPLSSSKDMSVQLGGIREGSHTIQVVVDITNVVVEDNESNNDEFVTCVWKNRPNTRPDLSCEITAPTTTQGLTGERNTALEFVINNEGLAPIETSFKGVLKAEGNELGSFTINKMPSSYSRFGTAGLTANGLGTVQLQFVVDPDNTVQESNEKNNSFVGQYPIKYCNHVGVFTTTKGQNSNVKIWYDPRILGGQIQSSADILNAANAWNNISENVKIVGVEAANASELFNKAGKEDIVIIYAPNPLGRAIFAETQLGHNSKNEQIKVVYCLPGGWNGSKKTLTHEIGHCLGLGHPNERGDSCDYPTIMRQSGDMSNLSVDYISVHDKYNLIYFNK